MIIPGVPVLLPRIERLLRESWANNKGLIPDIGSLGVPETREQLQQLLRKLSEILGELQKEANRINTSSWKIIIPAHVRGLLELAERVLAESTRFMREASTVPFAVLDDIQMWQKIQMASDKVRDNMGPRGFDRDLDYAGRAADKSWEGKFYDAYTSQIANQSNAVAVTATMANRAHTYLSTAFVSACFSYAAWVNLAYSLTMFLSRIGLGNPTLLIDGGQYSQFMNLYLNAKFTEGLSKTNIGFQALLMKALIDSREGLTQAGQPEPGQYGVDREWPNPFNDRLYMRVREENNRVVLDGGAGTGKNEYRPSPR
ncbi:hypothetical protein GCM10022225_16090 [Plantactinospora mayteni]|uniref:Uncharacterized protein n=1 Tax=Plantactinospora mayteni TaxID=566021 RepID=A0ABQ4EG31_9ACTN|nr:hypothetical protein [Plantactinospora mayteni]GIG93683.1 hypothetical protein Pma05_02560 [Plantactinospora mayteni]